MKGVLLMNRNKKTKNVKVNKAIDNMGDSATIDALNASLTNNSDYKLNTNINGSTTNK